ADVGLLDDVLRLGIVTQHAARNAEETLIVSLDQHPDRTLIADERALQQRILAEPLLAGGGAAGNTCFHHWRVHLARFLQPTRTVPLARISSTAGNAFSAASGRSPAGALFVQSSAPGFPTTIRPTIPACSWGMQ